MGSALWDERPMRTALVDAMLRCPRVRLDWIKDLPDVPGVYLFFVASSSPRIRAALSELVATGRYPAYCGVSERSLRERLRRYRQSVANTTALSERDLYVSALPLPTAASAVWCERVLIELLDPPLQGLGFGNKIPGGNRSERSPIDALLPGRRWAHEPATAVDQAAVRLRILARLLRLDPTGPRWDPIQPGIR